MEELIEAMETLEKSNGMDVEFGETFGTMVTEMSTGIGTAQTNEIILDITNSFFRSGGYVKNQADIQKWFDDQKDLLPEIEGMKVTKHLDEEEPGAWLTGHFGNYHIEIGIEDNLSREAIKYYVVTLTNDKSDIEGGILFHEGVIFTIDDIKQVIQLAKDDDIKNIINLINRKYYRKEEWIDTPKCILEKFHNTTTLLFYTAQINIEPCICGKCNI